MGSNMSLCLTCGSMQNVVGLFMRASHIGLANKLVWLSLNKQEKEGTRLGLLPVKPFSRSCAATPHQDLLVLL